MQKVQNIFISLWDKIDNVMLKHREMKTYENVLTGYMKMLPDRKKLTKAQKEEIQHFYKGLIGRKVSLYSHEYFYSRSGVFAKEYVPTNLYYSDLLPKANKKSVQVVYCDKNMLDVLIPDERVAHVFLKCMNGFYYYEGRSVTREDAMSLCENLGAVIVKPSLASKGRGVQKLTIKNGKVEESGETLDQLLKSYGKNFNIQECIVQHERMAALNPTSVNTIRVLSYRFDEEVVIVYAVVRIGRLGKIIDNQSAGGISTTIDAEGKLGKYAVAGSKINNLEKTDTGVVLDGYQLPSYDKAMAMVKRMHTHFPYSRILGWDIAIDQIGDPILVELNTRPGLSQSAFGSGMGEYTERIIRDLWPRPNTKWK